jgi:putative two-component system response regulator
VSTLSALSRSQRRTVERLARAAEFRDEETANHTQRVSRYCALLSTLSGLDERRSELIGAASMMHDIGKLGIPDSILRKPGALSVSERRHMQRHADYGRKILAGESDPLLDLAAVIAWTHHERWDGHGYPQQMSGAEIPLEGRIVAIGDVFDALTSDRVYRPAMTLDHALGLMRAGRGTHFDPELLDLFVEALPQVLDIRGRHPDRSRPRSESEPAVFVY